ncbi:MAG: PD-(D/E)XK nuclease family protein [Christensenellales bacterium]
MSVTVLTGRSGSGKSRFLMAHIASLIKDPFAKIIMIVPGQLTFETEKKIMKSCCVQGIFGVEVLSIQRLALKIIEDTGCSAFISEAEKAIVCRKALLSLNNPFGDSGRQPDFDVCAADLISRLKSYNQTPETLREAAGRLRDEALAKKLCSTADLYEKYIDICKGRSDTSDMYTFAAARADRAAFLKGAHVVIDGLDSYSPAVMTLLTKVVALSGDTIAAFRSEGDGTDSDLFASEKKDMKRFIAAIRQSGKKVEEKSVGMPPRYACPELAFLEANLYRYPYEPFDGPAENIRLFEAESAEQEIEMIASNILAEIKNGRRFRDIAIVAGSLDSYVPVIKTKFSLCGIPFFIDERRALSDNTFFDFLYNALCAAAGDMTVVPGYLFSYYAPLTFDQKVMLKKYARSYALKGWHYFSEFRRGSDAGQTEALRAKVMSPLLYLSKGIRQDSAKKQILAIKQFLKMCRVEEKLTEFCDDIDRPGTRGEFAYFSQVFEKSIDVLAGIEQIFEDTPVEPNTLCSLVKTGFSATKIAVIPPTTDEVGVFDISVARLPDVDVLFAMGVHDGVWPAKDDGPGIMSAAERSMLFDAGFDIGIYDASAEKLKVYSALVKPKHRLYVSYNMQTGQPSILIDRIRCLFPRIDVQRKAAYAPAAGMQAQVLGGIADALNGKQPAKEMICLLAAFLKQPGWREKAVRMLLRTNAALPIAHNDAAALYGGIRCSATRIETYYKCPFKHFLDFGIKAQPERDYTNDKVDTGTFMHLALDFFIKSLLEDNADIKSITADEVKQRIRAAAAKAAQMHNNAKLLEDERFAMQYDLLTNELVNTAHRIKVHFEGTQASIYASEQIFNDYTVDTVFGDVVINGKIDRIDVAGGYFRVVDYKSSDTLFSLKDFSGGVSLQLPIYIKAAKRLLQKAGADMRPAGGYYMRIGDVYRESSEEVAKAARITGISLEDPQVLCEFSTVLPNGSFAAIDQSITSSGRLNQTGKKRFFTEDELTALFGHTDTMIKNAVERMYCGDNAICPAEGITGASACVYCNYTSVCMKDAGYEGNGTRLIESVDKDFLTEGIRDEPDME